MMKGLDVENSVLREKMIFDVCLNLGKLPSEVVREPWRNIEAFYYFLAEKR